MRPFNNDSGDRLLGDSSSSKRLTDSDLTPELLELGMRRGRQMRAQAAADLAGAMIAGLRRLRAAIGFGGNIKDVQDNDLYDRLVDGFRAPLTAIRSSAEILRDNPDIDASERARFVEAVLHEEARLEALVSRLLGQSQVEAKARVWRVRLQDL